MLQRVFFLICLFAQSVVLAQVTDADRNTALALVRANSSKIGLQSTDIDNSIVNSTYIVPGSDVRMVYLQQSYKGIPVYNQLHVLAFRDQQLVSIAGSRIVAVEQKVNSNGTPSVDVIRAVQTALTDVNVSPRDFVVPVNSYDEGRRFEFGSLGVSTENIKADLLWFPSEDRQSARLIWQVFAAPQNSSAYWLIRVDAMSNTVIGKSNLTVSCNWGPGSGESHKGHTHTAHVPAENKKVVSQKENKSFLINTASYRVIKYPVESPIHPGGSPALVTDPWLLTPGAATTLGWHNDGVSDYDSTRGNNVFAYEDLDNNNLPGRAGVSTTAIPNLNMNFVPDFSLEPVLRAPVPNQQFNTTNLFYWNNLVHDLSYVYGFTETARNFQSSNLGRGGLGNDYVLAEAQDGSGTNNANFATPPDGDHGRMQMFLWTDPVPDRDGDVDNGIIVHEYTHGISNRMTGTGFDCLTVVEQMGEGWSDYLALMMTQDWATATPADGFNNPRGIATYALNQPNTGPGIREYRYTTNMAINPLTYANLPTAVEPHGVGTIWCTALWDMTWLIIQQAGINPNLFNPAAGGGNAIALKLVMEGLRLQPCNPGFIDGRNAILKADTLFFGAQYSCAILEAFARRGMGINAAQGSPDTKGDENISFDNGQPAILIQPVDATVCAGLNHLFVVAATGVNLSYQWQLSTDGGTTFNNISGANSSSYALSNVTVSMNNHRYRCIISGCAPSVTSTVVLLTVATTAAVTSSPANITVCTGANASFTVAGTGSGIFYQWQISTNGGANYTNISGANSATLNLLAVTTGMNNNLYRCVLNNSCNTPVISAAAILTVNAASAISAQPLAATICSGAVQNICITATGTNLNYQWERSNSCAGPWVAVGSNSSCISVSPTATTVYRCTVTGVCGAALISSCATVTVINPVTISAQPANAEFCLGGNASFSVTANSSETINYQWQVSVGGGPFTNITGANNSSYSINNPGTALSGNQYRCQMTTSTCSSPVNTNAALLTVRQLPSIILSAAPLTSLLPGQTTTLTASPSAATGGTISLNWFQNNNPISNNGNTRVVNVEQLGTYRVNIRETFSSGLSCSGQSSDVVIGAQASDKLFIFPSPNDGRFTISYYNSNGASTQRRIIITDAKGARVYDKQFNVAGPYTLMEIDLRSANRGIYFVSVGDAAGAKQVTGRVHVR